jgi:hypothetical protein
MRRAISMATTAKTANPATSTAASDQVISSAARAVATDVVTPAITYVATLLTICAAIAASKPPVR